MINSRLRCFSILFALLCLGLACFASAMPVEASNAAQQCEDERNCPEPSDTVPDAPGPGDTATELPPGATATQTPGDGSDSGSSGSASGSSGGTQSWITHIIQFPFQTMTEAVLKMTSSIAQQAYDPAGKVFAQALDAFVFKGIAWASYTSFVLPGWKVLFTIALGLLPATLALTAVDTLKNGTTSVIGYADLKEALIGWVINAGLAAASYYLLSLAYRISAAAVGEILSLHMGNLNGMTFANIFFNSALIATMAATFPALALYIGFFAMFLAAAVLIGLGLAIAASTAMLFLLSTIAPLVIVLGGLPPLRWLPALWLKTVTIAFLVPIANAFLLKSAYWLYYTTMGTNAVLQPGTFLGGMFITAGVISALITLDFQLAKFIFGALGEVHEKALDATKAVIGMAVMTATAVAGGLALGGLGAGAGAAAGGGVGGGGGAAAGTSAGAATAGANGASATANAAGSAADSGRYAQTDASSRGAAMNADPQFKERVGKLAANIGRSISRNAHDPITRGFGNGLEMAGEGTAFQAANTLDGQRREASTQRDADRLAWQQGSGQGAPGQADGGQSAWRNQVTARYAQQDGGQPRQGSWQPGQPARELDQMINEYNRRPSQDGYPDALSRPHYNPEGLMGRFLERKIPEAPPGEAQRLNSLLHNSIGQANLDSSDRININRDLWGAYQNNNATPQQLGDALRSALADHQVTPPDDLNDHVARLFNQGS